ncbi:acetylneuraminic acid synthetase [bacterium]|nr:acetylneuraminic acid synthetase [bacterium]|tara:strand:- start:355 stop:2673 length:2319 start_codon:yes stop_codon:yes gene_type:complete
MSIITQPDKRFILSPNSSIKEVLEVIHISKAELVFICDEQERLLGVVSQGDLNKYLLNHSHKYLDESCRHILNTNYRALRKGFEINELNSLLTDYKVIPILGSGRRLMNIAYRENIFKDYSICDLKLSKEKAPLIIAEIGNNHNGDFDLANKMISSAVDSGADIVKFQMRDLCALYGVENLEDNEENNNLSAEYLFELLNENQLQYASLFDLFDRVKELGKQPLCTPWDIPSLQLLHEYGMKTVKIASADLTNHQLLSSATDFGMNLICSTGMSTEEEIIETSNFLSSKGSVFYLMHCQSSYPAGLGDINLSYMDKLRQFSRGGFVGYSSHDLGVNVCLAAVARGANIIEKHFTTDKSLKGIDHRVSLLPDEFSNLVQSIKEVSVSIGRNDRRILSQGELINRATLSKSLVTSRDLKAGKVLSSSDITLRSPGHGLQPNQLNKLTGQTLVRDLKKDTFIYWDDVLINSQGSKSLIKDLDKLNPYSSNWDLLPGEWGIPVRPHDVSKFYKLFKPKMIEFHLSYRDLEKDPNQFLDNLKLPYSVIHAPELFKNELLLDLCSLDNEITKKSISELQKVIDFANIVLNQIPNQNKIGIVTNVGGHSDSGFLDKNTRKDLPKILIENISKLNLGSAEIWPQTMPPYPWHFGGQRYHNLFVEPLEIISFKKQFDFNFCLDISHTQLACNFLGIELIKVLPELLNCSTHLHIADADTINGEGLQIDKGSMNFLEIMNVISQSNKNSLNKQITWIPEIWQGHENNGTGFKIALDHLCEYI